MRFNDEIWDVILHVLAIAVLADHRVKDPERIEFVHQAQRLNRLYFPDRIVSRDGLKAWLATNQTEICGALSEPNLDEFVISFLSKVDDKGLKIELTKAIFGICICDYEVNDEEAHILKLAMQSWGIPQGALDTAGLIVEAVI